MSRFFIDRPIFAWVIAILIVLGGVLSIGTLGVQSYPDIAPPEVGISASYPGADAATAESAVTRVIEQELTGIDNMLYFSSSSSAGGNVFISVVFKPGTNPDAAAVQVQNRVALATPRLPSEVIQNGVQVTKASPSTLEVIALTSSNPAIGFEQLNDLVATRILDPISRVPGVGSTQQFGAPEGMRIWLDPQKLEAYGLSATDVENAVRAQNIQFAAGSVGADPAVKGWNFTANVMGPSRFSTPQQFRNIILKANRDGSAVTLGDVAKVEFGPEAYGFDVNYNGRPVGGFQISLSPGANGLKVAKAVSAEMRQLQSSLPPGVSWFIPFNTTTFVTVSMEEVLKTLVEAIALVFLVMLVFLQDLRATIIPAIVIPIALLGAFLGMKVMGFSINQLTMFGMVLAIGIVVDDAIVVIENVQRIMTEEGLSPRDAARKGMDEIAGAIIAITVVLAAVFVPSALQAGASGIIYRQFALTIATSMVFSAFLALTFTPALCASFLKPVHARRTNFLSRRFNDAFGWTHATYVGQIGRAVRHAPRWMAAFLVIAVLAGFLYLRIPGGFIPQEDQGYVVAVVQLPPGATKDRTDAVMRNVYGVLKQDAAVSGVLNVTGFSFQGSGENAGMAFVRLKPWSKRSVTAAEFIHKANMQLHQHIHNASVFVVNLPTVSGLGQFGGFDMYLENRGGSGRAALRKAEATLLAKAAQDKRLSNVSANELAPAPQLKLSVNRLQAASMGLSISDIANAVTLMLAPVYVDDFESGGYVRRVIMRAAAPFRMSAQALGDFYTPSGTMDPNGMPAMIPLSNVVHAKWVLAPLTLSRFDGYPAVEITGAAAPGLSSGQAMAAMQQLIRKDLPHGFGLNWAGQSLEELLSGNAAMLLMGLSVLVVFLALAALYESWSIPISVILIVPLTLLGVDLFTMARGLSDDIFFKVGLITVIGLAAKNAILIVEYAHDAQKHGATLREAVVKASRLRFRPILMTSLAFILGVLPLAVATGAGANARHAIGTTVIGGMVFATFLGLLLVPVFYVVMRRLAGDKLDEATRRATRPQASPDAAR